MAGQAMKTTYSDKISTTVSSKSYQIQFESGSAVILPGSYAQLDEIMSSAIVAEGLKVGVYGHTDNTGSLEANQALSESRADAVKSYLISKGLPTNRIESKGFGQTQPIAENKTAAGKAQNRRVQIVLGQ